MISQILVAHSTGTIAEPVHLWTARPDEMQQIGQRNVVPVSPNQRSLPVLPRASALRAFEPHHGGGVFGQAEGTVGNAIMLLVGVGDVITL